MHEQQDVQRPRDWETIYTARIDGKTLEAMKFLARYVLESDLPSLSGIAAADCVHCWQRDVRKTALTLEIEMEGDEIRL